MHKTKSYKMGITGMVQESKKVEKAEKPQESKKVEKSEKPYNSLGKGKMYDGSGNGGV